MSRRCGWCGRATDDYIACPITVDHGPIEVVWCKDWAGCNTARVEGMRQSRRISDTGDRP